MKNRQRGSGGGGGGGGGGGSDAVSSCNRSPEAAGKSRSAKPGEMAGAQGLVARFVRHNILTLLNIAGVIGGVVVAIVLRSSRNEKWTAREIMYVGFVGQLPFIAHLLI